MSGIVQSQEKEISHQQASIERSVNLAEENQMLKERIQELQVENARLR